MKHISTEELGFTFPCLSSEVTKARMEKYNVNYTQLWQDCNNIIKLFEIDLQNSITSIVYKRKVINKEFEDFLSFYKDGLERFLYSDISLYDTTFLNIGNSYTQSICACAVPLDNLLKKARKLVNL